MAPQTSPSHGPRKRNQLYTSCEPCKLRKVRCERERENTPCRRCVQRSMRCVTTGPRPRKPRTGKRVEEAMALYGTNSEAGPSTRAEKPDSSSATEVSTPQEEWNPDDLYLSDESAESGLSTLEMIGQLSSHLLEVYFSMCHFPLPLRRWQEFRKQFDEAGRRPEQMKSPMSEVLLLTLIAYGARVSNAPAIVGRDAPALEAVDRMERHLLNWGRRRNTICEKFVARAIQMADERGAFRKESNESIAVLLYLDILISHGDSTCRKGRPYRLSAIGHARTLMEERTSSKRDLVELEGGGLGSILYLRDTSQALISGRRPLLAYEDEQMLWGKYSAPGLPTVAEFARALNGDLLVWDPIIRVWDHIAPLERHFTTRMADELRFPLRDTQFEEYIWDIYRQLDQIEICIQTLEGFTLQISSLKRPSFGFLSFYVTTMRFGSFMMVPVAHRAIVRRCEMLDKEAAPASLAYPESSDRELRRWALQLLKDESQKRMRKAAREEAATLAVLQSSLPSRTGLGIMTNVGMLWHTLPDFAQILCDLPTIEEGDSNDYSLDTKIMEVGWFLSALQSFAWAWEDIADTLGYVELRYEVLKEFRSSLAL